MNILQKLSRRGHPTWTTQITMGPVRITEIPGTGRGMVATKKIAEGILLLCSKAFTVVFEEKSVPDIVIKITDKLKK
ncbi:hypothetical protein BC938DRAFT_482348 [Jimgerdemannia flammicorona]|uniref:Uncharacterized protein n=1 Tax=Jimgerdemannia flammicorona TaxID=994334 RepID=A0A433QWN5_9FUNG|nr:hypothetical protein BC938DRAFT_482348 [Jimgerdemannia flammicorona]